MEGTKTLPVYRKLKIIDCSPFKDKTSWQSDFTSPVIENSRLQKEDPLSSKKSDKTAKVKSTVRSETLYQDEYTEKDIPLKSPVWIPNEHLVFKGTMMTSSIYDKEYQKKNSERQGYCKRVQSLFKGLDTSFKGKIKSTYMDDFPIQPPKRVLNLPSLPKEQHAKKVDSRGRKFETETTYSRDYFELNFERPSRKTLTRVGAIGIIPRLPHVRFDQNFTKSVTSEELARVAERFPKCENMPRHPINHSLLKFDGKIILDTLYDLNNYADPTNKRWFTGHRLDWKLPQQQMKPRKLTIAAKVVGNPLTWRYV